MKNVFFWIVALIVLFRCTSAHAADWSFRGGPGLVNGTLSGGTKTLGFRRDDEMLDGIYNGFELGGYVDNLGGGRKGAIVGKAQLGVKPGPRTGVYGYAFIGPCLISATDSQLGGMGQICSDIGVGVRDEKTIMGFGYAHISSAGMETPNKGRDYLVFSVGVSL